MLRFRSVLRICKALLWKGSFQQARFLFYQLREDISNLDDGMLLTQLGYFGHHVEKAIKHQSRDNRGIDKRNRLEKLILECESRSIAETPMIEWARHIVNYFDTSNEIYIDRAVSGVFEPVGLSSTDVLRFIEQRTSVRFWQARPISRDIISQIIEISLRSSPMSCNRQTIRVIAEENDDVFMGDSNNYSLRNKAPVLLYLLDDERFFTDKFETSLDVGSVCATIMLAASAFGVCGCWMYEKGFYKDKELRHRLDFPENYRVYSVIALGYPLDNQEKPPRIDISKTLKFA